MLRPHLVLLTLGITLALSGCSFGPPLAGLAGDQIPLPESISLPDGLAKEDMVHIGDKDYYSVYAGINDDGRSCATAVTAPSTDDSPGWFSATTCVSADEFAVGGVELRLDDSAGYYIIKVLPNDFKGLLGDDFERVNDNLAVHYER